METNSATSQTATEIANDLVIIRGCDGLKDCTLYEKNLNCQDPLFPFSCIQLGSKIFVVP